MSTSFTYDTFAKTADEVKQYDDWVPEILANDQKKLKLVNDKVLPFVFQNVLQRTVLSKDANGKNRERFLDLLVLNYSRLGKKSLGEAQETFMKQLQDMKVNFATVLKAVPATDTTSALRIDTATKNADLLFAALKGLNQAAIQKDLDARLALTAPADTTVVSRPVLINYAVAQAYDDAVAAKAIDAAAATTEKALVIPAGSLGSELVTATLAGASGTTLITVGSATDKAAADKAATDKAAADKLAADKAAADKTAADTAAADKAAADKAAADKAAAGTPPATATGGAATPATSGGPTEAYTPPGADDAAKNTPPTQQQPAATAPAESSGLSTEAIVGIAVGVLLLLVGIIFLISRSNKSKEEETAVEGGELGGSLEKQQSFELQSV